jgi:hypothetical protein
MLSLAAIMALAAKAAPIVKGAMTVASVASPIINSLQQHSEQQNRQEDPTRHGSSPLLSSALQTAGVVKNFFDDDDDDEENIINKINKKTRGVQRRASARDNASNIGKDVNTSFFKSTSVGRDLLKDQFKKLTTVKSPSSNLKDTAATIIKSLGSSGGSALATQMKQFGGSKVELLDAFKSLLKG